ncbi:peptidylprolyl isomerase [Halobacteriovorax vibrionivorans]|uniref:Peptidyl-prolyl cis-trans isomerase n=2 Tax=Halobacteriovoraceae TaxID=1652132 RepID=A0ABY0IK41_9BACT|nr:peptidylprolyl isomerase [Halobacteriovorax vibrionivorans]TGD47679.1 peptidylprolyl isomerase [Halobacteriovorax sp. Y22]
MMPKVIGFNYTLTNSNNEVLDTSSEHGPLLFLEGVGQIIPGLEEKVIGMAVGEKAKIDVAAADAYGNKNDELIIKVQKSQFPADAQLNIGDVFQVNQDQGLPPFTIVELQGEEVTLDGNHPLAGQDLTFDIEITEVREATDEEVAHGHAHGVGGVQH